MQRGVIASVWGARLAVEKCTIDEEDFSKKSVLFALFSSAVASYAKRFIASVWGARSAVGFPSHRAAIVSLLDLTQRPVEPMASTDWKFSQLKVFSTESSLNFLWAFRELTRCLWFSWQPLHHPSGELFRWGSYKRRKVSRKAAWIAVISWPTMLHWTTKMRSNRWWGWRGRGPHCPGSWAATLALMMRKWRRLRM